MLHALLAVLLLFASAPSRCMASRELSVDQAHDEDGTPAPPPPAPAAADDDEEGPSVWKGPAEKVDTEDEEGGTVFKAPQAAIDAQKDKNKDTDIQDVYQIQSKLRFRGNKVVLKNPQLVAKIAKNIKDLQAKASGRNFMFCLHIGTSAPEVIMENRRAFMEGRAGTFKKAFQPGGPSAPMIDGIKGTVGNHFFHFNAKRFAAVVMKTYKGTPPECVKKDLLELPDV